MSKIRKPEENENGASGIQIAKLDHDFQPNAFSAHTHGDELEIVYLRQGVVSMEVDGIRFDARSGAVVVIPANVKHWHGAAADHWMSHVAFEAPGTACANEWCEPVTDEEYAALS